MDDGKDAAIKETVGTNSETRTAIRCNTISIRSTQKGTSEIGLISPHPFTAAEARTSVLTGVGSRAPLQRIPG